jgi:hypothetical protein
MKSSRCRLVACSDVMGSSVTDILGAAEALAPAVTGAAIGSQIRETGPNRRAEATPTAAAPFPGGPLGGVAWSHFGNTSKTAERFLFFSLPDVGNDKAGGDVTQSWRLAMTFLERRYANDE